MRHVRLNLYERVAGFFVLFAAVGSVVFAASVAVKQGWFDARVEYSTMFASAEGVHTGTSVKMAGLSVGSVREVELLADNRVKVTFDVLKKFSDRLREDSRVSLVRPFIIGDRVLEVSVGSEGSPALADHAVLTSEETMDIMSVMSGRKTGQLMAQLAQVMGNLQTVVEAFADKERVHSVVRMFDRMEPLIDNVSVMSEEVVKLSRQMNKDQNLGKVLQQAVVLTSELNRILPELNRGNPEMGADLAKLTKSLGRVTAELDRSFSEVDADMPSTAARMVEALNEATVLIKAMQKSLFVRGSVREVREEEAQRRRLPASAPTK
ncbi:MAG: MCE family protein [Bdellovibrionaceae bacterium]|nr:MCE family protein [Pseudobdellovibrionaceae bacterium]